MVVHTHRPQRLARFRVHGVDVRPQIPEVRGVAALRPGYGPHADGRHDRVPGLEGPVHAAGLRVERVHHPVVATHEHSSPSHRRLTSDQAALRKAERPLPPQPRHLLGRQPRDSGRLKASTGRGIGAHTVPVRPGRRIAHRHATGAAVRHRLRRAVRRASERAPGQGHGQPAPLLLRELAHIGRHRAGRQRLEHPLRGERSEGFATDRAGGMTGRSMADRALLLEEEEPPRIRHLRRGHPRQQHRDGDRRHQKPSHQRASSPSAPLLTPKDSHQRAIAFRDTETFVRRRSLDRSSSWSVCPTQNFRTNTAGRS